MSRREECSAATRTPACADQLHVRVSVVIANAIEKRGVTSMAAKLVTATQRPITPQNEREAGEHDGPSADEENIFQTRGPAEVLTEFGERREGESAESYSNHRPLERSAAA